MPNHSTRKSITPSKKFLSKADFAKAAGVSAPRVSQLITLGLPVTKAGLIELASGMLWLRDNLDPQRRQASKPGKREAAIGTVAKLRASKLEMENAILALRMGRERGELIDRQQAKLWAFGRARLEQQMWTGWVTRAAAELASELAVDPHKCRVALDRLIREQLTEIGKTPMRDIGDA